MTIVAYDEKMEVSKEAFEEVINKRHHWDQLTCPIDRGVLC